MFMELVDQVIIDQGAPIPEDLPTPHGNVEVQEASEVTCAVAVEEIQERAMGLGSDCARLVSRGLRKARAHLEAADR